MFIGRKNELKLLQKLREKKTSSLVCLLGRRRIGKSTLIEEYGKSFKNFISIQGLAPAKGVTNRTQLDHFSQRLAYQFKKDRIYFESWGDAFYKLGEYTQKGDYLILLDEISWMGRLDPAFSSVLKDAWDTQLKKNPKLVLVACGSVSSWIEDNIIKNMNFEGRLSLEINLEELTLTEANQFFQKKHLKIGTYEKLFLLSIMGGVPKYLEEVIESETLEKNIIRLCYNKEGILFNDFEKIFTEIFERKSKTLEKIIRTCLISKLSPTELAKKMKRVYNEELHHYIHILELSGFLSRDFYYKPNGIASKLSHLRVKDNYLRFYLKNIEPLKEQISKKAITIKSFRDIKNIDSLLGYQFENLILANRPLVHQALELESNEIRFSSPYKQNKLQSNKGACQIDLLIGTQYHSYYICEFKCQKVIDRSIIKETMKKVSTIQLPKQNSIHPILVYAGEIYQPHFEEIQSYFFKIISFDQLLSLG